MAGSRTAISAWERRGAGGVFPSLEISAPHFLSYLLLAGYSGSRAEPGSAAACDPGLLS
jgi:hypothetical protein